MNLHIIDFAGQKVISGVVGRRSDPVSKPRSVWIKAEIKGPAFVGGKMVDSAESVIFTDRDDGKFTLATWFSGIKEGTRVTVVAVEHEGKLFALKATAEEDFILCLKDENGQAKTILYGSTALEFTDPQYRFSKTVTTVKGINYTVTFWNNPGSPMGERVKKVFSERSPKTFVVCGKMETYNGKPSLRGSWFICD